MAILDAPVGLLQHLDFDDNQFAPPSPQTTCPSLTDSFISETRSQTYLDATRRSSFASSAAYSRASRSPGWYSAQSAKTTTPTTPFSSLAPFESHHSVKLEDGTDGRQLYLLGESSLPELEMWMSPEDSADMSHLAHTTAFPLLNTPILTDDHLYGGTDSQYPQTLSTSNPSLSRSIFELSETAPHADSMPMDEHSQEWSVMTRSSPQTIAPSATFQPFLISSPVAKQKPSTPSRIEHQSSSIFSSSPVELISPPTVPSQNVIDESEYGQEEDMLSQHMRCRGNLNRLHRREFTRRRHVGSDSRPKAASSRSGMLCDAVIAGNEFLCGYTGCSSRFKRQEHKKRHERTVHEKSQHSLHRCWVPGCLTAPFTRTDNLKSHLKNTHGAKKANQRNKYVATLDKHSGYYDPDWEGELTEDGYPVVKKEHHMDGEGL